MNSCPDTKEIFMLIHVQVPDVISSQPKRTIRHLLSAGIKFQHTPKIVSSSSKIIQIRY